MAIPTTPAPLSGRENEGCPRGIRRRAIVHDTNQRPVEAPLAEPHGSTPGGKIGETKPETANEAKRKAVLEQKQFVTGRISETCRYIGFGVLAVFYAVQSAETPFATKTVAKYPDLLYVMAVAAAATILFDYLQYVSASWAVDKALNRKDSPNTYNKWWVSYQCRAAFFWLKQVAAFASAICLCYIVLFPA